jgi:hypothetical protein
MMTDEEDFFAAYNSKTALLVGIDRFYGREVVEQLLKTVTAHDEETRPPSREKYDETANELKSIGMKELAKLVSKASRKLPTEWEIIENYPHSWVKSQKDYDMYITMERRRQRFLNRHTVAFVNRDGE